MSSGVRRSRCWQRSWRSRSLVRSLSSAVSVWIRSRWWRLVGALALDQQLAGAVIGLMFSGGAALEVASRRARRELTALVQRAPKVAQLRVDDRLQEVPVEQVQAGEPSPSPSLLPQHPAMAPGIPTSLLHSLEPHPRAAQRSRCRAANRAGHLRRRLRQLRASVGVPSAQFGTRAGAVLLDRSRKQVPKNGRHVLSLFLTTGTVLHQCCFAWEDRRSRGRPCGAAAVQLATVGRGDRRARVRGQAVVSTAECDRIADFRIVPASGHLVAGGSVAAPWRSEFRAAAAAAADRGG